MHEFVYFARKWLPFAMRGHFLLMQFGIRTIADQNNFSLHTILYRNGRTFNSCCQRRHFVWAGIFFQNVNTFRKYYWEKKIAVARHWSKSSITRSSIFDQYLVQICLEQRVEEYVEYSIQNNPKNLRQRFIDEFNYQQCVFPKERKHIRGSKSDFVLSEQCDLIMLSSSSETKRKYI